MQKKLSAKLLLFIKTNKCLVKFLRNSIRDLVLSGTLLGTLKVTLLRSVTIQSAYSYDYLKVMKVKVNMQH